MAVVNMCNYVESFKRQKVDGQTLVSLTDDGLLVSFPFSIPPPVDSKLFQN